MDMYFNWYNTTLDALNQLWGGFVMFLPGFLGAIIVFIIGWFIAYGFGKLITEVLKKIKFDEMVSKEEWRKSLEKAEVNVSLSDFLGHIGKWIILIIFLWASMEIMGLNQFANFIKDVVNYLPNIIVSAFIFVVAVVVADILSKIVVMTTEKAKFQHTALAGEIVRWSIWIFAIFTVLMQLDIATEMLSILFKGVVALIVIAGGLAFGLGGKEVAADILQNMTRKMKK